MLFNIDHRALLAGGFGTGIPAVQRPLEIAPVVPSGGDIATTAFQRRHPQSPPTSPPNGRVGQVPESFATIGDAFDKNLDKERGVGLEGSGGKSDYSMETIEAPLSDPLYARFHLDLASAVASAVGKDVW